MSDNHLPVDLGQVKRKLLDAVADEHVVLHGFLDHMTGKTRIDWSAGTRELWKLWQRELRGFKAPPPEPTPTGYDAARDALARFQRAVEKLPDSSPSEPLPDAPVEPQSAAGPTAEPAECAPPAGGMSWQDAAERLERLRAQGDPWTSYREMASRFRCSTQTIHKAVHSSPELTAWAKTNGPASPRAQSLNDVVTNRAAQLCELDPVDDAAIREFVEGAEPETRAWFLALPVDEQLEVVNDPDKYPKILNRKP